MIKPPTDSIYKFVAHTGVLLVAISLFPYYLSWKQECEATVSEAKRDGNNNRLSTITEKLGWLPIQITQNGSKLTEVQDERLLKERTNIRLANKLPLLEQKIETQKLKLSYTQTEYAACWQANDSNSIDTATLEYTPWQTTDANSISIPALGTCGQKLADFQNLLANLEPLELRYHAKDSEYRSNEQDIASLLEEETHLRKAMEDLQTTQHDLLREKDRIQSEVVALDFDYNILKSKSPFYEELSNFGCMLFCFGLVFAIIGFISWFFKLQCHQDKLLKHQVEQIEKPFDSETW